MSQAIIWFRSQLHRIVNADTSHSLIGMALFNTLQKENRNSSSCTDYFKHGCHPGNSYVHVPICTFQHRATWRSPDLVKDASHSHLKSFMVTPGIPQCPSSTLPGHQIAALSTGDGNWLVCLNNPLTFVFVMGILTKAILLNITRAGEATTPVWKLPLILVSSHPNIFAFSKHQDFQRPTKRSLFLWSLF